MVTITPNASLIELKSLIRQENFKEETVEVILSNLLALIDEQNESFSIPFDDVIVTIKTALRLLQS
ncbi:hypothetical protein [Alteromonas mediterranea]|uniref:Uncharacterized protein n=1 Tax=Alteromonas mediterranea (strain DSM 17117 / CIP 110805 / LMG 28347 / Deep ecotype) TaxID=1774373 RepID=F2G212_ALTMD|nr:hypothetical protein [Alteromonas mediterranea]AEA96259.1 hypothetical protein MADE_1000550 [Alteromonas mediterranea DE]CAH1221053.1 hypothetical protein ISS312_02055 [Alteromonas mediterranea]